MQPFSYFLNFAPKTQSSYFLGELKVLNAKIPWHHLNEEIYQTSTTAFPFTECKLLTNYN